MSSDIKVNDLVYVAKPLPCCGNTDYLGVTFKVDTILTYRTYCILCGHIFMDPRSIAQNDEHGHCVTTLKKFDPKSQCDDTLLDIVIDRRPELSRC